MTASRLTAHLQVPLFRNAYALAANTIITSVLGAGYWVLAARLFGTAEVGIGSALIAAMTFLTSLAGLNLNNALNRFLPSAGAGASRLLVGAYAVSVPLSAVGALVFIAGVDVWSPGLDVVRSSTLAVIGFTAATMVWTVFVLQDSALAGLRRATWIPIENGVYGVAKIVLIIALAGLSSGAAIFASWTLPLIVLIIPVNYLIFRKAIPEHVAGTHASGPAHGARDVARFAGADYFASLLWMATTNLLPIVVLELAGAEANAYFYLAWTIAYTLYLVSRSMGVSLITEGALEPAKLVAYSRRVIVQTGALIVPAVLVLVVAAPLVLSVFGADYAREASATLRLLALSAIPNVIVSTYVSIARVERRMRALMVLHGLLGALVIGLTAALLPRWGVVGVGWAWLIAETLLAVGLLAGEMRSLWMPFVTDHGFVSRLSAALGPSRRLGRRSTDAAARLPALLEAVEAEPASGGRRWHVAGHLPTDLEIVVASLETDDGEAPAVVKLAAEPAASPGLLAEAAAIDDLHRLSGLGDWPRLVPQILATGGASELAFFIEDRLEGQDARGVAVSVEATERLILAAAQAIAPLHRATATVRVADAATLHHWVGEPLADVARLLEGPGQRRREGRLDALGAELERRLLGTTVTESWIHGDYWLGNLLVDGDHQITGIVDWGQTDRHGLPHLDFGHLVLTARVLTDGRQFGQVVVDALADPEWNDAERTALSLAPPMLDGAEQAERVVILLTWLRHVSSNVRKSTRYRRSWLWMARNVDEVLRSL